MLYSKRNLYYFEIIITICVEKYVQKGQIMIRSWRAAFLVFSMKLGVYSCRKIRASYAEALETADVLRR
jgi:hypothetical protein